MRPGPVPFSCALRPKVVAATVGAGVLGHHSNQQSPPLSQPPLGPPQPAPLRPSDRNSHPSPTLRPPFWSSGGSPLLFHSRKLNTPPHTPFRPARLTRHTGFPHPLPSSAALPFLPPGQGSPPHLPGQAWCLSRPPGPPSAFLTPRLPSDRRPPSLPPASVPGAGARTHRTRRCIRSPRSSPRTSPASTSWDPSSPRGPRPEPSRTLPPPPRRSPARCARLGRLPGRLGHCSRAHRLPLPHGLPEGRYRCHQRRCPAGKPLPPAPPGRSRPAGAPPTPRALEFPSAPCFPGKGCGRDTGAMVFWAACPAQTRPWLYVQGS